MNKKILSIFVMVMALSLLGVSCNKKTTDPTNGGGSTTQNQNFGTLTIPDVQFGSDPVGDKEVTAAITGLPKGVTATYAVKSIDVKSQAGLTSLTTAHFKYDGSKLTLTSAGSSALTATSGEKTFTVTVTVSAAGYNSKDVVITCKVTKS